MSLFDRLPITSFMSSSGRLSWAPSLICSSLDPTYGGTNSLARSPVFEAWRVAAKIHLVAPTTLQKRGFDRLSAFNLPRAILQVRQGHRWTSLIPWFDSIETHSRVKRNRETRTAYKIHSSRVYRAGRGVTKHKCRMWMCTIWRV